MYVVDILREKLSKRGEMERRELIKIVNERRMYFLGSGPEGVDDLCFHTYGGFSPSPPPPPPPAIQPLGCDFDFEAEIWASRLGSGRLGFEGGT